jgi:hypothetical protein
MDGSQTPQHFTSRSKQKRSKSTSDKVSVCIRFRPLNEREIIKDSSPVWRTVNNTIHGNKNNEVSSFTFDHVYDSSAGTQCIYEEVAKNIVQGAVEGYNGTIFAYGQTSSGKTHTMKGNQNEMGIIPRAVTDVFDTIAQTTSREFLVRVSYIEIYNEDVMDLLNPEHKKLKIREDLHRGVFVNNLTEKVVTSPQQILELMELGETHRHFGATQMNDRSSRSHTIFRLSVESRRLQQQSDNMEIEEQLLNEEEVTAAIRVSTLNLVDLAGSERVCHTQADGDRALEGAYINKSLLALGSVINKIVDGGPHIPYRDSNLTRILQTALGGNSRTAMIFAVTPAATYFEETKTTLKFARRAKKVTNQAHVNEVINDQNLIQKLKREAGDWKFKYKDQLQVIEGLSHAYENLKSEAHISQSKFTEMELLLKQVQLERQQEQERIKQLELENQQLQICVREQHQNSASLEQQIVLINQEKSQNHDDMNALEADYEQLASAFKDQQLKYESLNLERQTLQEEIRMLKDKPSVTNSPSVIMYTLSADFITNEQQAVHLNEESVIRQLQSTIIDLKKQLEQKEQEIVSIKTHYENQLQTERNNFDVLSKEQLQRCCDLEQQIEDKDREVEESYNQFELQIAEQIQKQNEEYELFAKNYTQIQQEESNRFKESEKEYKERIEQLERDNGQYVVDSTPYYVKLHNLQQENEKLKHEIEELRMQIKRRREATRINVANKRKKVEHQPFSVISNSKENIM